jgi:gliding motility-associated-like protein
LKSKTILYNLLPIKCQVLSWDSGKILLFLFFITGSFPVKSIGNIYTSKASDDSLLQTKVNDWIGKTPALLFCENKGQMADMQGNVAKEVLFKTTAPGMDMYLTSSGLSYVFLKIERHKKGKVKSAFGHKHKNGSNDSINGNYCRADMELVGAEISMEKVIKEMESEDYTNYYLGGICPDGVRNVHSYEQITIKNVYPGIDWVLYTTGKSAGLKYNFIVHPGADVSRIKLRYKWTDGPCLQNDGSVKIGTPMGEIIEGVPVSYQEGSITENVATQYVIDKNEISFSLGNYDKEKNLVIDPVLKWATYYGTNNSNIVADLQSVTTDGTNVWVSGAVICATSLPTVNPGGGAYFQGICGVGGYNAFILKFNTSGVIKWATYYGGNGTDAGYSISSDGANVWVTGVTSSTNFPLFNPGGGAYFQATLGVGALSNAFILQFNTSGLRKWATYYGGNGTDAGYSISSDGSNVWVTGETSSTNFPVLNPGGSAYFQGTLGVGATSNAFVLQFNTSGVLKWATYYGGNRSDLGFSVSSDGSNVWITGKAQSTNFPVFNPGGGVYFQGTLAVGSTYNAFILQFNTSGVCKWATYYGGNGDEVGNSISSDGANVWVSGATGSTNFPVLNPGGGAYFQGTLALGCIYNAFVLQFNTSGVLKWGTYYGGNGQDDVYSISSDGVNVWIAGVTSSTNFPTLNPANGGCGSYFQGTLNGGTDDIFILQFNSVGVRKWASYYGTDSENDGSSICSDGTNVFLSFDAETGAFDPLLNPGGGAYYQDNIPTGSEITYIAKFCIACSEISITPVQSNVSCDGANTGTATVNPTGGVLPYTYSWSSSAGNAATANGLSAGTYTCTVTDSIGCSSQQILSITSPIVVKMDSLIPNIFTPNGDDQNDYFTLLPHRMPVCFSTFNVKIYDRWGVPMFESSDFQFKWDGHTNSGAEAADGIYYYRIDIGFQNENSSYKGYLQLMR